MERKSNNTSVLKHDNFSWDGLGDIKAGRGELGEEMPVLIYRLMQFTMLDILSKAYGHDQANDYFRQAGFLAGSEFAKHTLNLGVDFDTFLANLKESLENLKIGILGTETYDPETGNIEITVGQDLDCSGMPNTHETICNFDEGFIAGILEAYTGKKYYVRETDCCANGGNRCRFNGTVQNA